MISIIRSSIVVALCAGGAMDVSAQSCLTTGRSGRAGSSQHSNISDSDRGSRATSIRWKRGDCELRLDARGEFTVTPDLTGFTSVDDYVEIEERDGDHSRKVRISSAGRGLEYRWSVDGTNGFDVDRDRWLANTLLAVERRTAMFAKSRVPLLLKQGGPDAVLDETYLMDADYAKRQYYSA